MLKKTVQYEDYNGNTVNEDFYFNLSKAELIEMDVEYNAGLGETLQRIIETKDSKALIMEFKKLILISYGKKSEDGKRFIKNETLRNEFEQSAAYSTLFMELAMDDKSAADFIKGVLPKDMAIEIEKQSSLPLPPPTV